MALIDVIKYEGSNNVLVWKHPKEDFNTSAQLIVHQSQEAILFKDGQASEPFKAGKHTIETENIPGIRNIVGLVTGGVSPNHYEVYYINKAYSMEVYWGTTSPWTIQDPTLQIPFNMRAHGQSAVRVSDSQKLMLKLVGTMSSFTQREIQKYFGGILSNLVSKDVFPYDEDDSTSDLSGDVAVLDALLSEGSEEILLDDVDSDTCDTCSEHEDSGDREMSAVFSVGTMPEFYAPAFFIPITFSRRTNQCRKRKRSPSSGQSLCVSSKKTTRRSKNSNTSRNSSTIR